MLVCVGIQEFSNWLNAEMKDRDWGVRETGRRAGIAPTLISNILNGGDTPSFDTCVALADAFNKPRTEVVMLAGLLPTPPEHDEDLAELIHLVGQLEDEGRQEMIDLARVKLERLRKAKQGAERAGKSGAKQAR